MKCKNAWLAILMLVSMAALAARAQATAVVVPTLNNPVTICSSPTIRILAHGIQSPKTYRVTVEIENRLTTDTLVLAPPLESLRVYRDDYGTLINNREPTDETSVWLRYDTTGGRVFPVRRMKPSYVKRPDAEGEPVVLLEYQPEIEVPGRTTMAVDLDFDLPPGEVPLALTFIFDRVDLGHGVVVDAVQEFDIVGRGALRYLLQAYGPYISQRAREAEQQQQATETPPTDN
jgi:hypothetical protein